MASLATRFQEEYRRIRNRLAEAVLLLDQMEVGFVSAAPGCQILSKLLDEDVVGRLRWAERALYPLMQTDWHGLLRGSSADSLRRASAAITRGTKQLRTMMRVPLPSPAAFVRLARDLLDRVAVHLDAEEKALLPAIRALDIILGRASHEPIPERPRN
jgi:hypothetical protein